MKKKIIIFVSMLVLLSMGTSFLNLAESESTPSSPHEGDAYVGEFWLEIIESPPPLVDDIVIGHTKATHDWIIYDSDSNVVADYYINNSIATIPDINISFYLLVYLVINDTETVEVGMDYYRINNSQLINYYPEDVKGKLSVSLSNLSFDGENVTLLCTLEAVVENGLNDKDKPKLISFAQDECIVAIEKYNNNNGNFSYYLDQAEGNATSMWSWILGRNVSSNQSLTICGIVPFKDKQSLQEDNSGDYWSLGTVKFIIMDFKAVITGWEDGELEHSHEVYENDSMIDIPAGIIVIDKTL